MQRVFRAVVFRDARRRARSSAYARTLSSPFGRFPACSISSRVAPKDGSGCQARSPPHVPGWRSFCPRTASARTHIIEDEASVFLAEPTPRPGASERREAGDRGVRGAQCSARRRRVIAASGATAGSATAGNMPGSASWSPGDARQWGKDRMRAGGGAAQGGQGGILGDTPESVTLPHGAGDAHAQPLPPRHAPPLFRGGVPRPPSGQARSGAAGPEHRGSMGGGASGGSGTGTPERPKRASPRKQVCAPRLRLTARQRRARGAILDPAWACACRMQAQARPRLRGGAMIPFHAPCRAALCTRPLLRVRGRPWRGSGQCGPTQRARASCPRRTLTPRAHRAATFRRGETSGAFGATFKRAASSWAKGLTCASSKAE